MESIHLPQVPAGGCEVCLNRHLWKLLEWHCADPQALAHNYVHFPSHALDFWLSCFHIGNSFVFQIESGMRPCWPGFIAQSCLHHAGTPASLHCLTTSIMAVALQSRRFGPLSPPTTTQLIFAVGQEQIP
jgi:hypothetical protein